MTDETPLAPVRSLKKWHLLAIGAIFAAVAGIVYTRVAPMFKEAAAPELPAVTFMPADTRGTGAYPDGTYTAIGTYEPHGFPTDIEVVVQLENDSIVASDVTLKSNNPTSIRVTKKFLDNYKPMVIGKPIQRLELGAISGSSLTPKGYNQALRKIETYAAAQ